jgi:hypothetical protein
MAGNRARLLVMFLGIAVALTGLLATGGPAWSQMEDRPITLDLKDVQLEDALRLVFKDTPYSFTLAPGLGGRTVTLTLNDVTFSQALRAILGLHKLTYRKAPGDIYEIMPEIEPEVATTSGTPQPEDEAIPARMNLYWFGPGGRYELQYLDCRLVAIWFGGRQITSALVPVAVEGGGGGGMGGGRGGIGGGVGGGMGGIGGGIGGGTGGIGGGIGGSTGGIGGGIGGSSGGRTGGIGGGVSGGSSRSTGGGTGGGGFGGGMRR